MNESAEKIIKIIKSIKKDQLQGTKSHLKLVPMMNNIPIRKMTAPPNTRESAVLIPLIEDNDGTLSIILTLRSENLSNHQGQISFPGGKIEKNETIVEAALRETFEEIGVEDSNIEIIGQISDLYVPPSNSVIHPVIGLVKSNVKFKINQSEVQEIIKVKLEFLLDKSNLQFEDWDFKGEIVKVPLWRIHKLKPLWGATAMILSELIDLINSEI
ncbi:MAG: NUDIX hydrolase [Candidatus Kapaibacteriota bacterium]